MICNKCSNNGTENEVLGKKFWYCRTRKDEIIEQQLAFKSLEPSSPSNLPTGVNQSYYDYYYGTSNLSLKKVLIDIDKELARNVLNLAVVYLNPADFNIICADYILGHMPAKSQFTINLYSGQVSIIAENFVKQGDCYFFCHNLSSFLIGKLP